MSGPRAMCLPPVNWWTILPSMVCRSLRRVGRCLYWVINAVESLSRWRDVDRIEEFQRRHRMQRTFRTIFIYFSNLFDVQLPSSSYQHPRLVALHHFRDLVPLERFLMRHKPSISHESKQTEPRALFYHDYTDRGQLYRHSTLWIRRIIWSSMTHVCKYEKASLIMVEMKERAAQSDSGTFSFVAPESLGPPN